MSNLEQRHSLLDRIPPALTRGLREEMTNQLSLQGLTKFVENCKESVHGDFTIKISPIMCRVRGRQLLLWIAHYWSCTIRPCLYCEFICRYMADIVEFLQDPSRAGNILERLEL